MSIKYLLITVIFMLVAASPVRADPRDLNPTNDPDVQRGIEKNRSDYEWRKQHPSGQQLYEGSKQGGKSEFDVNPSQQH